MKIKLRMPRGKKIDLLRNKHFEMKVNSLIKGQGHHKSPHIQIVDFSKMLIHASDADD